MSCHLQQRFAVSYDFGPTSKRTPGKGISLPQQINYPKLLIIQPLIYLTLAYLYCEMIDGYQSFFSAIFVRMLPLELIEVPFADIFDVLHVEEQAQPQLQLHLGLLIAK